MQTPSNLRQVSFRKCTQMIRKNRDVFLQYSRNQSNFSATFAYISSMVCATRTCFRQYNLSIFWILNDNCQDFWDPISWKCTMQRVSIRGCRQVRPNEHIWTLTLRATLWWFVWCPGNFLASVAYFLQAALQFVALNRLSFLFQTFCLEISASASRRQNQPFYCWMSARWSMGSIKRRVRKSRNWPISVRIFVYISVFANGGRGLSNLELVVVLRIFFS